MLDERCIVGCINTCIVGTVLSRRIDEVLLEIRINRGSLSILEEGLLVSVIGSPLNWSNFTFLLELRVK